MSLDVAVSGISVITGLGDGIEAVLDGLNKERGKNHEIDASLYADIISDIDKGPYELHRIQKLTAIAFMKALSMSKTCISEYDSERIAVILGNSYGVEEFKTEFFRKYKTSPLLLVNPSLFPYTTANSIAAWLAIQFRVKGFNLTFTNGCISGSSAIISGCDCITSGKADIAIVLGISFLCDDFKDDFYRSGFKQEISGAIILEKRENVVNSGRKPLALIKGFKHGFLFEEDIKNLNSLILPGVLQGDGAEITVTHLGNSLGEVKFKYHENQGVPEYKERRLFPLNNMVGNAFSSAGVLGMAFCKYLLDRNEEKVSFVDVDSHGAYVKFNVRI